jgi:O-succinylbenzoic acid--CoA ligase
MKFDFPGIILNDHIFSTEDLIAHSKKIIRRDIPDWEKSIYEFILDFLNDKDYILQQSSGTTGTPKEFHLSKKALIESAQLTAKVLNLKFADKALLCLPVDYIAGKMMIIRSFVSGLNLIWEEPTSMPVLSKHGKINFCAMVPLQVYNSFSNYEFFRNIENLIIGGAELRSELLAMFHDVTNNTYETYGMAETCSHIALRKISGDKPDKYFETLPGITLQSDERGCLIISAPYLNDKVTTNDLVELIDSTHFIWKGRFDNLINTGGIKIKPEELEASIAKVLDAECAIVGLADKKLGQKVILITESKDNLEEKEILSLLKESLPAYHIPGKVYIVNELPRNKAFKIDRKKLLAMIEEK